VLKNPEKECIPPLAGCGFSQKLSSWDIKAFRFPKNAKASFCTPKTTFSTVPLGLPFIRIVKLKLYTPKYRKEES